MTENEVESRAIIGVVGCIPCSSQRHFLWQFVDIDII